MTLIGKPTAQSQVTHHTAGEVIASTGAPMRLPAVKEPGNPQGASSRRCCAICSLSQASMAAKRSHPDRRFRESINASAATLLRHPASMSKRMPTRAEINAMTPSEYWSEEEAMTPAQYATLEARLRSAASRQDLRLRKSRARDPQHSHYGTYMLVDRNNTAVACGNGDGYGLNLRDVSRFLAGEKPEWRGGCVVITDPDGRDYPIYGYYGMPAFPPEGF